MWILIYSFQMNTTRSIWSKTLNCCKLRRHPETIFLCVTGVISFLPLLFYVVVRYCGPIRDLPNVLKRKCEIMIFVICIVWTVFAAILCHEKVKIGVFRNSYYFFTKYILSFILNTIFYRIKIQANNLEVGWWKNKLDW